MPQVHDEGFAAGERRFRLFVFSRLFGEVMEVKEGRITFKSVVKVKISSPLYELAGVIAENLLHMPAVRLGEVPLRLSAVKIEPWPDLTQGEVLVKAISPITVYSTLTANDGKKKTYYYHPSESEFEEQVRRNVLKKAQWIGLKLGEDLGEDPLNEKVDFRFQPVDVKNSDLKVIYYRDTVVKGWYGVYKMSGDPRLLALAYSAGIGSKNSQGFGMLEVVKEPARKKKQQKEEKRD